MRPAKRFRNEGVDHPEILHVGRGNPQRLGSLLGMVAAAPQDRGASLRRNHRIDGMFEHDDAVAGRQCDGTARPPLADDAGHHRGRQAQAGTDGSGDGLGLATFLGAAPRIGAGRIDKAQHRQPEPPGKLHQARRLAVSLGPRHAEIAFDAFLGAASLFRAHDHHGLATEARHATDHGVILGIVAIASQWREILEQLVDDGADPRTLGMTCHLDLFPGPQLFIGLFQFALDAGLQLADFVGDVDAAVRTHMAEFLDLALKGGYRFFEIQKMAHDVL